MTGPESTLTATGPTSPLRYPGGKATMVGLLRETIEMNGVAGRPYWEPFAGGAGAALGLLRDGVVSRVHLNDYDPCVYAFWRAACDHPKEFRKAIREVDVTPEEWNKQRAVWRDEVHRLERSFELGFATFFLNRCSRSGIIAGSAPIGGNRQKGKWKIGARFNKQGLVERIRWLEKHRDRIVLSNDDALRFLSDNLPRGGPRESMFVYLDPPYYTHGRRLYFSSYQRCDHQRLARYVKRQRVLKWIMSYDDCSFVSNLYGEMVRGRKQFQYSLQRRNRKEELLIAPSYVRLPDAVAGCQAG